MTTAISSNRPQPKIIVDEDFEEIKDIMKGTVGEVLTKTSEKTKKVLKQQTDQAIENIITPISYSEATNFRLQHALFTQLEKKNQNTQWIRIPAFLAAGNRYLVYLITRICSIAELSIHSLSLFLSSEPNSGNRIRAQTMIRHIPTHFGELLVILPALLFDVRCIISDLKAYIGLRVSIVRITINHLEEGTLHTEKYFRDCNEAAGRFK